MYSNAAVNKSVNQTFYTVNGTIVWDPVVNSHENDFHQAQLGFKSKSVDETQTCNYVKALKRYFIDATKINTTMMILMVVLILLRKATSN